ncbi:hypothetical protein, partial [Desulfovibrio sp.]|uniref:hypothetical protein n=1 Tax=Desulfovibrio sp. TaxID=885 RepID=UPI00257EC745
PEEVGALFPAQSVGVGKSFGVMLVVLNGISYVYHSSIAPATAFRPHRQPGGQKRQIPGAPLEIPPKSSYSLQRIG